MSFMSLNKPIKVVHIDATRIREELENMVKDGDLKTSGGFINFDEPATFIEKHMSYLATHPKVNPEPYLANLRTMIKIRPFK